ncbi:MAG: heavy metal-binding domain-containing protein, partial [Acidimicrobiia bacterium]
EPDESIEEITEDIQEADQAGVVDSGAAPFLSDDESEAALTGITDASPEDDLGESVGSVELTEAEEPVAAGWWSTETSDEPAESEGPTEPEEPAAAGWWETRTTDHQAESDEPTEPEEPAPADWWEPEPDESIEEITEDIQEADQAGVVDSGAAPFLSEDELEAALAGITDAAAEDDLGEPVEHTEAEEPVAAGWWESETTDDQAAPLGESVEAIASVDEQETMDVVAPVAWDEPADHQDESTKLDDTSAEPQEGAAVIDSPVEWGTRYREAHQGWVEDDEGRSTWRPIVTSGESVAGWDIDIYLGLVSGDISIDPVSTDAVASEVAVAREGAVRRMLDEGLARGAHAIVGVTFSIQDVGGIVLVGASGVAVTLRTPA